MNDKGEWCQEAIRNKRYARHDTHWCKRYLNRSFRRKNNQIKEES